MIISIGVSDPFSRRHNLAIEFMNECLVMLGSYHMFILTDFVANPDTRYLMGKSLISIACLSIIINLAIVGGETLLS